MSDRVWIGNGERWVEVSPALTAHMLTQLKIAESELTGYWRRAESEYELERLEMKLAGIRAAISAAEGK